MTEEQIRAEAAKSPDAGARALFGTYYNYVYAIVYRCIAGTGTREDAEECVSDVFLEVLQHLPEISSGSLKAYIGTAARHKALNICRGIARRPADALPETMPSGQDVAADAELAAQASELMTQIRSLGEPDATILIQKYYYDRNAREIGKLLGMNPITVRSRLSRALRTLRSTAKDLL
ncbi:MAG: sigma-70 family RNA polymerase sigma factor [Oscillospiraceae bacterium]|nr:sigma-70 family RNA polymerase sigma factor [Oscillospiraceae bacterium]